MSAFHILIGIVENDYKRILNCKWSKAFLIFVWRYIRTFFGYWFHGQTKYGSKCSLQNL